MNEMPSLRYQFFGSADSADVDVVFFVDEIPDTIRLCSALVMTLTQKLTAQKSLTRPVNGNLAVCKEGVLLQVFKGTADELNNSLFYTYDLHIQDFENAISRLLKRDTDLKFLRSARMILAWFTRTRHRVAIKEALRQDIDAKYDVLIQWDFPTLLTENHPDKNILKSIAFQIGQTLALDEGKELYTKKEIALHFPALAPFLNRQETPDFHSLNGLFLLYLSKLNHRRRQMKRKTEYEYEGE